MTEMDAVTLGLGMAVGFALFGLVLVWRDCVRADRERRARPAAPLFTERGEP